jgi:hypothetical protein
VVLGANSGNVTLQYVGTFYGAQSDLNAAIAHLATFLPAGGEGQFTSSAQTNWLQGLEVIDGSLNTSKPDTVSGNTSTWGRCAHALAFSTTRSLRR